MPSAEKLVYGCTKIKVAKSLQKKKNAFFKENVHVTEYNVLLYYVTMKKWRQLTDKSSH